MTEALAMTEVSSTRISKHILAAFILALAIGSCATAYMGVASFAYFLMILGVLYRAIPKLHARFMASAIALDLSLVLTLEIQRHAINTALSFTLSPLQQAHIAMSSIATALYFPTLYLGWQRLKNPKSPIAQRGWHIRLGVSAFIFRSLGFILMFALLKRSL